LKIQRGEHSNWFLITFSADTMLPPTQRWLRKCLKLTELWGAIHFLLSHLDFFLTDLEIVIEEHRKMLHHNISTIRKRYEGKWNPPLLAGSATRGNGSRLCLLNTSVIFKGKLQIHTRGNKVKRKHTFPISIS
jgi:hypothetical protein